MPASRRGSGFCCAGCHYVYELIGSESLDRFYDLAGRRKLTPVGDKVFQSTPAEWARRHQEVIEATLDEGAVAESWLEVGSITCAACIWLIEARFEHRDGAVRIAVDASDGSARLTWIAGRFDLAAFVSDVARFGYEFREPSLDAASSGSPGGTSTSVGSQTRALGLRLGAAAAFAMNTMAFTLPRYFGIDPEFMLASLLELVAASSATLGAAAALSWFAPRAWQALRSGVPHIDLPIVLGIAVAWLGSVAGWALGYDALLYFDFVAVFSTLMLAGRWVQERAMAATRSNLRGPGLPRYLTVEAEAVKGEAPPTVTLATPLLEQGSVFHLAAGEVAPVNAVLIEDHPATVSREWISGEADPLSLAPGAVAVAGTRNAGSSHVRMRALEPFAGSELSGLANPQATQRNDDNRFGGRLLRGYLWTVIALSLIGGAWWWLVGHDALGGLQVTISILVVSCPCAIGVAIPLADRLAAARAAEAGAVVRTPKLWRRLSAVRRLVFDKTGTLTVEFPQLADPAVLVGLHGDARAALWKLVARNRHPYGQALRAALIDRGEGPSSTGAHNLDSVEVEVEVEEIPGKGVRFTSRNGVTWCLGSARWLDSESGESSAADCVLSCNAQVLARFEFREQLRDHARDEIAWLGRHVGEVSILSGDRSERVAALARRLGLDAERALGDHSPQAKADWLDRNDGDRTLFIGDGANDRHAFDRALTRGAPLSAFAPLEERLDFVLLGGSLSPIRRLFGLAARHRTTLRIILAAGIGYNLVAVALCLQGLMHPLLAAVAMPLSSLLILTLAWWRLGSAKALTPQATSDTVNGQDRLPLPAHLMDTSLDGPLA